ncbi:MAG: LptF/LptG family permease [Chitinophagaceae bacterium]
MQQVYIVLKFWSLYKDDFGGIVLSSSRIRQWLWMVATGPFLTTAFILALFMGVIYYSHYKEKKDGFLFKPFSFINVLLLTVFALTAFLYTSFYEGKIYKKQLALLINVIYEKSQQVNNYHAGEMDFMNNEHTMNLTELYHARDSLIKNTVTDHEDHFLIPRSGFLLRNIKLVIAKKTMIPLMVFLFYLSGVWLGSSLYKVKRIFPLLIGYVLIFNGWIYGQSICERLYKRDKTNAFIGANGINIVLAIIAIVGYFIWRKKKLSRFREEQASLSLEFQNEQITPGTP